MRGWLSSVDLDADDRTPVEQAAARAREADSRPTAEQLEEARAWAEATGGSMEAKLVRIQRRDNLDPSDVWAVIRVVADQIRDNFGGLRPVQIHLPPAWTTLGGQLHAWGVAADDLVALAHQESTWHVEIEDDDDPPARPQPSRSDLRARQRADERAAEARMRHQHHHPAPRGRRR